MNISTFKACLALTVLAVSPAWAETTPEDLDRLSRRTVTTYADHASRLYAETEQHAVNLHDAIDRLLADPGPDTLEGARKAWIAARETYGRTEALRFYGGPIDHPQDGVETWLNAWPLDEAYIDYVVDDPQAGLINAPEDGEISAELLLLVTRKVCVRVCAAAARGGEENQSALGRDSRP